MSCSISRSHGLVWSVRHDDTGVIIDFVEGLFNDKQTVRNCDIEPDPVKLAKIMREIGDSMYELRFMALCDCDSRVSMIEYISENLLIEAANKLHGVISWEHADEAFDYIDIIQPSKELRDVLIMLDDDELKELVYIVDAFWVEPYDLEQWAKDLKDWTLQFE